MSVIRASRKPSRSKIVRAALTRVARVRLPRRLGGAVRGAAGEGAEPCFSTFGIGDMLPEVNLKQKSMLSWPQPASLDGSPAPARSAFDEPRERLSDADRLRRSLELERLRGRQLDPTGDLVDRIDRQTHPDPSADREWRREPDLVVAVVQAVGKAVEADQLLKEARPKTKREQAVDDRAAERTRGRPLRVDMDPLAILGRLSELVDPRLIDGVPPGRPEHRSDKGAQVGRRLGTHLATHRASGGNAGRRRSR